MSRSEGITKLDNELDPLFQWIWFGIVLVVALPCTVVSILSMLDFFNVKSDLKEIKETLQGHKSRPYFELHGIKVHILINIRKTTCKVSQFCGLKFSDITTNPEQQCRCL